MSTYMWGDNETQFFFQLGPGLVLDAIDELGLVTTGRCLTLNSMENRVYEIEIDIPEHTITSASDRFVVAKFYRPGRWTEKQIREEHQFLKDLTEAEIPVIAPLEFDGETLFKLKDHDLFYTVFPKKGGRVPDEMNREQLEITGRTLARLHTVGASRMANHRIQISPETYGTQNSKYLLDNNFIPSHIEPSFKEAIDELITTITPMFDGVSNHRIHGDCHLGNIISREEGPFFIDFDDMLVGPAVQDVWLIVPGDDEQAIINRNILLESYDSMRNFDYRTLKLIEPLRTLRYIHFAAWTAKRWEDPAFKLAFPHFGTDHYWSTLNVDLRVQLNKITPLVAPNPYGEFSW
ncbi:MAG: serine/threonine protein kinase [Bacteriovoracaceae bacterium]|nr:serine/threonine protein kinase [Bacteriovoracaceae bacterium]